MTRSRWSCRRAIEAKNQRRYAACETGAKRSIHSNAVPPASRIRADDMPMAANSSAYCQSDFFRQRDDDVDFAA